MLVRKQQQVVQEQVIQLQVHRRTAQVQRIVVFRALLVQNMNHRVVAASHQVLIVISKVVIEKGLIIYENGQSFFIFAFFILIV